MSFARSITERRERRAAEKAANLKALATPTRAISPGCYAGGVSGVAIEKENAVEHEGYRRLVASFCCARCFVVGYSQAAHPPPTGKSIKEDDRKCFPLCCTREGQIGCHWLFDNYKLMPHDAAVEQAEQWGRETRAKVINQGLWPKGLAMLNGATT